MYFKKTIGIIVRDLKIIPGLMDNLYKVCVKL